MYKSWLINKCMQTPKLLNIVMQPRACIVLFTQGVFDDVIILSVVLYIILMHIKTLKARNIIKFNNTICILIAYRQAQSSGVLPEESLELGSPLWSSIRCIAKPSSPHLNKCIGVNNSIQNNGLILVATYWHANSSGVLPSSSTQLESTSWYSVR